MSLRLLLLPFTCILLLPVPNISAAEDDQGPDSQEQADVPKGTVQEFSWKQSTVFPGTERQYWIYLPPGFDKAQTYPLMVFQDGGGAVTPKGQYRVPIVLDNLIHKKEVPAMVALFINPGSVPPAIPGAAGRSTRSFEYDTPNDRYATFLIDEMLPEVAKLATISAKPEDRCIAGVSSGGICAFTVAWFRPDQFRKVITGIGSFTNIQGGTWYPGAIRKTERKPLRIFLQENTKDLDNVHGSWPIANQDMVAALTFAGYDLKTVWGQGGHSGKHLGAILPDALRWIWRPMEAAPKPTPEVKQDIAIQGLLIEGQEWQEIKADFKFVDAPCADAEGNLHVSDLGGGTGIHKIAPDGSVSVWNKDLTGISGMKFGADGRLYACHNKEKRVIAVAKDGTVEVLMSDIGCNDLAVDSKGRVYVTETGKKQVVLIEGAGKHRVVASGITAPNGLTLSPDQGTLAVSDYAGAAAVALRVDVDGSLSAPLPVMPYRAFGGKIEGKGDGMTCDTRGRWYVASASGIQVFDPNGRPTGLVLAPTTGAVTSTALAGNWLYALTAGKVFRRQVNAKGFLASAAPFKRED
ncbi:MAG: SMP-30/gluconolactonase/LRE family protein [Planctomycetes bacterium]|nr:SMP-30/gluconolactonase/LRE family protein [Planctomycetota bacterium]